MSKTIVRIAKLVIASGSGIIGNLALYVVQTGAWVLGNGLSSLVTGGGRATFHNREEIDAFAEEHGYEVEGDIPE